MTRSKKKTTKDKKKEKKKKKRNARRKSSSQYDSDSSSSSSSSSSSNSSSSTTSSSDSDDESTVAYNNIGTKANAEMSFSSNPKERKHQTSKVAKVLKRLHESAKQHHLSEYSVTRGTIDKRKSYFRTWIETLKHIFFLDGRYSSLLAKYPLIDCSNISTTSNMALSQFLFTKLEASSRDQVRSCLNDHLDGAELLKYLQQNYGATTIMDCTKALQRLKDTTWEYQDTVDTFSNRFLRRAETYRVTLRSTNSSSKLKLEDVKLLTMYLESLTTTMPSSHPLHQTVQTKFVELESCITAGTAPSFKFIQVMHQMRHLETINLNNTTSTRHSYNKVRPRNQSRPPYVKANAAAESTKPSNQANLVTQSRKFKPVKCWGCGHHHNLRDCPTTSDEQKQALYQQKREEKEQRTNGQPNRSAHQQANKADTPKSEATPTTETSNPKNTVHKVTEMPRRRGTNFAAPVMHFSGTTRTLPHTSTLDREALKEMFTLIRDWLIDSGCTAHMSPVREDFIGDLEPHQTMVEVANGSLVEVQWRGTVKLLLIDKFDPSNQAMVYLQNVLYVPMLSRRLLSVAEWNQCGGQINFLTDKCRVQILDSDDFPIHTINIDPIYAADEINNDRVLTVSAPKATPKKIRIKQELLHQWLGHRTISTLLLADEDDVWADVKLIADGEKFCETCKITTARRANRGSTPLEQLEEVVPGMCIMVDLVKNPVSESITSNSYFPFYLTITDMASRFFVPMGIRKKTSHDVFVALQEWATSYGPGIDYTMHMMRRIHGDYDSAFRSEELRSKAAQFNITISFAAPRHQEQNGIHEANWCNIRNLAFAMMNQACVPKKFFHFAFEHAWKIHAVLPHKALTRADGKVQTPLGVYEGKPVGIESFRVLFCPVVMTYDSINLRSKDATGKQLITSYNRRNNPQRAIRDIHVGLPRHNTGYLVFVPQLNSVLHCNDVYFDENFESTLAYTQSRHRAHLDIVVTDSQPHAYDEFERTGSALWFCNKKSDPFGKFVQNFARADVLEAYDMDFDHPDKDSDDDSDCDDMPDLISRHDDTDNDNDLPDLMFRDDGASDEEEKVNNTVATSSLQTSHPESINITVPTVTNMYDNATDAAISPPQRYPKQIRKRNPKFALNAQEISDQPTIPIPEEFVETVNRAYYMEVVAPMQQLVDMDPTMFLPAPENWKQILKLPPHVMDYWSASLLKELKELIKKETFVLDDPDPTDPIIPVTAKFRVRLTKDGMIEKLKSRIALRGDLMRDNVKIPDTWCPIAGFRAFKIFLATAAYYKKRIYQLDYVAAFLQADVIGRKFTTLPIEWKEMFRSNTEVHKWLGRPLRLTKSLYGDRVANLAWDETQSNWLTSPEIGFQRLPSERSIYVKKTAEGMMMVLNAVDDQLYFATTIEMKDWFEKQTERRFDVQKLGQAKWYLQSRITQLADYSIILDQSRYAALVAGRYLSPVNEDQIPTSIKVKYASPLPSGTVFTKQDCSQLYADVMKIQEEFGFEYAAAVGSLIYLMNTFVKLAFRIRKLAKFMQKPGRKHFEILKHLLHHIQCHRCSAGIKFYSDMKLSPLYQMMIETGNAAHADAPLILFTDSSFQDCPDTTKSTGGYLIFMRGGVVDNSSHLAGVVCHSSCEAECCHATSGLMAAAFIRKVFNEILGFNSDKPLTIPLGIDSQSAMDTANSHKETSRTRHIARRYHYVRFAQMNSETTLFKVDGTRNPSNSMTKVLRSKAWLKCSSVH